MVEFEPGPLTDEALRAYLREQVLEGRAFVPGAPAVATRSACTLVVPLPSGALRLKAEVVFASPDGPGRGVGLQLEPLGAASRAAIEAFLREPSPASPSAAPDGAAASAIDARDASGPAPEAQAGDAPADEPADEPGHDAPASEASAENRAMHLRLRSLTGPEQRRVALTGNLSERVLLERLYGPSVWEPLLASGRLTLPEVATIARKGTVPKPLLELIGANTGWLANELVQRALLANPRTSHALVKKVLRMLPRHELSRVPHQTAYPMSVRQAAVVLLKPERR